MYMYLAIVAAFRIPRARVAGFFFVVRVRFFLGPSSLVHGDARGMGTWSCPTDKPIATEMNMGNPFCHVELSTDNTRESQGILFQSLQLEVRDAPSPVPGGVYTHIKVGEGTGGAS